MNPTDMVLELAELHRCRSPFTAKTITSPQICTARDGEHCHIFRELSVWNEFLSVARLELRAYSSRELCLGPSDNVGWEPDEEQKQHAVTLVCLLLKNHHCVAAFQMESWYALCEYEPLISSSLRDSPALRSLRLLSSHALTYRLLENLAPVIPCLSQLEELECNISALPGGTIQAMCLLVAKSLCLKSLSMPTCFMDPLEGQRFRGALVNNTALTRLFLNSSCLVRDAPGQEASLAKYLENNKVLTTLGIYCDASWRSRELRYVLESLTHHRTLTSFFLRSFFVDNNSTLVIEKFLVETMTLRKFEMEYCAWYEFGVTLTQPLYDTDNFGAKTERIRPWLSILKNNRSLEELTLNLSGFCPAECEAFFEELAVNTSLKRVVVEDLGCYFSRRHRARCKNFCTPNEECLESRQDVVMTKCKQLCKLGFSLDNPQDMHWFLVALPAVLSCDRITTVEFDLALDNIEGLVGSLIAGYLEKTKVLKHLTLGFHASSNAVTSTALVCRKTILNALSKNTTVRKLFLQCASFTQEETDLFATIMRSSQSINEVQVNTDAASVEILLTALLPHFSENHTLISAHFYVKQMPLTREYFGVKEVVRRNRDLVMRAAHYVVGENQRGHCAVAVEFIASNTAAGLVDEVCRLAAVDEKLALRMIRDSLQILRTMHGFMRAVGVVRKRVVCHEVGGRSVQLDDLDEWSWFSIRRHLTVTDVYAFK